MRFAYIDSNGNEVPIPSIDALALRIELGAITERTQLYDAQADQWGPAHTHEIFHTLARAAEEGEKPFVAPPPPVYPPIEAPRTDAGVDSAAVEGAEGAAPGDGSERAAASGPPTDGQTFEYGLTLAEPHSTPPEPDAGPDEIAAGDFDRSVGEARMPLESALEAATEPGVEAAHPGDAPPQGFGFGQIEGLEVSGGFEGADAADAAMDLAADPDAGPLDTGVQEAAWDEGSGQALDFERPLSDFGSTEPPMWIEPEQEGGGGQDVMDFSSVTSEPAGSFEAEARPRRVARDRPSPPRFRRERSLLAPIVGAVVLTAVGIGVYWAWPLVSAGIADRGSSDGPALVLPPLPDELLPRMRSVADAAFASTFAEARGSVPGGPERPPQDWLRGRYLAGASGFGEVEDFWLGIRDQLQAIRTVEADAFYTAYERAMVESGVPVEARPQLLRRADAGFRAAREARLDTYRAVDDLIAAALELHAFLVANEASIEYAPAAAVTSDPVLEATTATPELGDAMQERLARVTDRLGVLEYREAVTAEGLWRAVLERIQEVGIR